MQELFGPLSMRALEEDKYIRQIDGYLPSAKVAFIDEVFKANSAILNTLLTILNERLFDNGSARIKVPLICLVSLRHNCEGKHSNQLSCSWIRCCRILKPMASSATNYWKDPQEHSVSRHHLLTVPRSH